MRVISGTARSLQLKSVPGLATRPTTDRIKETIFNMIGRDVIAARFLDLFAGSGGIGIEAKSRGASQVVFVDQAAAAVKVIEENLAHCKFYEGVQVMRIEVVAALRQLGLQGHQFDLIFIDPPYHAGLETLVLQGIIANDVLSDEGYIILEADIATRIDPKQISGLELFKEKHYKSNQHLFLRKPD